jgi:UPF0755 protein
MRRVLAAILGLVVGSLLVAGGAGWWALERYTAPGPLRADTTVIIPKGAGKDAIVRRLLAAGVIEDSLIFQLAIRITRTGGKLKAGEYRFAKGDSMARVLSRIVEGKAILRAFTAPEGHTTHEIFERLDATEGLVGEISEVVGEGELLPETYSFAYGDTRDSVVRRMRDAMTTALDQLWEKRAPGLPYKSKREALIMASIIEKETAVASERPRIAAVFINRLRKGMRLQTDPTVIYGITHGKGPLGRRLLSKDLEAKTPYNTYRIDGLPPGPICNPGLAALTAALNPAKSDALFFVADGTGGHVFSKTLAEHNRNVARWRKLRREREAEAKKEAKKKAAEEAAKKDTDKAPGDRKEAGKPPAVKPAPTPKPNPAPAKP